MISALYRPERLKKQFCSIIFVLLMLSVSMGKLQAQEATRDVSTAHVFARIFNVFTSIQLSYMNFGHFSPKLYDGQLIYNPQGILMVKGNQSNGGDIRYSASFNVFGANNTAFTISYPKSPIFLTSTSAAKKMVLSNWKSMSLSVLGDEARSSGVKTVNLDATLKVGTMKDNPVGFYTGYYTITFGFN
jgi:hypothetical protein